MRVHQRVLSWLAGLTLAVAAAAQAQQAGSPAALQPAPAATAPLTIQVADIPQRADTDLRFADAVQQRAASADPSEALAPELGAIERSTDDNLNRFQPAQLRTLPILRLESLERHWLFDMHRLARWQADLQMVTASYARDAAELARRRAAWQDVKNAPASSNLPPALINRVDAVIARLADAEQALSGPLSRQIALGLRANATEERLQAGRRAVAQAIDYIDARLLQVDSPPLWALNQTQGSQDDAWTTLKTGLDIEVRFAREYNAADSGNQRALRLLQILLLPLLLWLAYKSRSAIRSGQMSESAARVLGRPFSTWLLLSMMGVLVFEADAPLMVHQAAMLLTVIPVLRLLPPSTRRQLDFWPYVATALYLVERLGFLLLASGLFYRTYTVALTLVSLAATLWLLHRGRNRDHAGLPDRLIKALRAVAWSAVALYIVSVISNLFGNVSLAEMLTSSVILSGYFGLMLYAGVTIIITLIQLLLKRPGVSRLRLAREHAPPIALMLIRLLSAAAVVGWAIYAMNSFRVLRGTYSIATDVLSYSFKFGDITISIGHILVFFISVWLAFWAARTIRLVLKDEVLTRMSLPRGVGNSIASLTYYSVLLLGLMVALSAAGFQTSQLALVFGALGVGIGFGLQGVVNNFVSGLILMFERPIQPGDVVDVGGTSGQVRDIGMRATRIKTFDGADVMVPNGTLLSEKLTNWTMLDRNRRIEIPVGVAYGTEPKAVIELLGGIARGTPGVEASPAPAVLFMGLGASALEFSVRAWTHDFDRWGDIRSDLLTRIYDALRQADIDIPFPQQDLHLRSISEDARSVFDAAQQRITPTQPASATADPKAPSAPASPGSSPPASKNV